MLCWLSFTWQEMSCTIKNRITIDIALQLNHNWTYNVNLFRIAKIHWKLCGTIFPGGGGVLHISSDSDDRRIFLGLKFLISGFFG